MQHTKGKQISVLQVWLLICSKSHIFIFMYLYSYSSIYIHIQLNLYPHSCYIFYIQVFIFTFMLPFHIHGNVMHGSVHSYAWFIFMARENLNASLQVHIHIRLTKNHSMF